MELLEIYNSLLAGKKLKLFFKKESEAYSFRAMLFRTKAIQDSCLLVSGILDKRPKLIFTMEPDMLDGFGVQLEFRERERKQYTVTILDDEVTG